MRAAKAYEPQEGRMLALRKEIGSRRISRKFNWTILTICQQQIAMGRRSKVSQTHIQNFGGTTSTSQSQICMLKFINAYAKGLSGLEAAWANIKYHGHPTLPPAIAADLKDSYKQYQKPLIVLFLLNNLQNLIPSSITLF